MLSKEKKMTTWISIGEVAKLFGVFTQTIINWSEQGVFSCKRTYGNHRRYSKQEVERKLGIETQQDQVTVCYSRVSANDKNKTWKDSN